LLALRSFGQKSLEEVQERLETLDLKPKTDDEDKKSRRRASDEKDDDEDTEK
jgi:DNA-directed RNA polymerase alpha subunit